MKTTYMIKRTDDPANQWYTGMYTDELRGLKMRKPKFSGWESVGRKYKTKHGARAAAKEITDGYGIPTEIVEKNIPEDVI